MNPILHLSFFGGLRLQSGDQIIRTLKTERLQSLFAYLILHRDRPQNRDYLAMLRTPELPEVEAKKRLNRALYDLRNALAAVMPRIAIDQLITADEFSVQWIGDAHVALDIVEFADHLRCAATHTHGMDGKARITHWEQAIALYQGDLLPHLYAEWLEPLREEYYQQAKDLLLQLSRCYQQQGQLTPAVRNAERLVYLARAHDDPDETPYLHLLRLAGATHNRSLLERTYTQLNDFAYKTMDAPPSDHSTALYLEMLALAVEAPPRRRLPQSFTPFLGRTHELCAIAHRLRHTECRLLTLTGFAGIGKSRLAIQSAAQLDCFAHGIRYVDLQSICSATALVEQIADTLDLSLAECTDLVSNTREKAAKRGHHRFSTPFSTALDDTFAALRTKSILLVLDHAESLRTSAAATMWIVQLLGTVPGLKILTTSRRRLGIRGEAVLQLGGLDEAVPFLQQAVARSAVGSSWLEEAKQTAALELCRLLDDNPLVIEAAANWAELLTVEQMIDELQTNPELLTFPVAAAATAQHQMTDLYQECWAMLTDQEQAALIVLLEVGDSFDYRTIRQVTGLSLPIVNALLEQAFLTKHGNQLQIPYLVRYIVHAMKAQTSVTF